MEHHHTHHAHMIHDFKKRFFISLFLTIPILMLSEALAFAGGLYILFAFSSLVYLYGGWPFLKGLYEELQAKKPGMMTLIGLAITVAYIYSACIVFGLSGKFFFWELATIGLALKPGTEVEPIWYGESQCLVTDRLTEIWMGGRVTIKEFNSKEGLCRQ